MADIDAVDNHMGRTADKPKSRDEYTAIMRALGTLSDRDTLNFGCGMSPVEGAVNHDRWLHSPHVDIAFDLDAPPMKPTPQAVACEYQSYPRWPIPDGRFARIIALDVFEHLRADIDVWLRECWRILADDGELVIRVAAWNNPVSYRDPTHRKVFHDETFLFFDPRQELWANYGRIYYPDGPWFHINMIERGNADPRWPGRGDICVVMTKAPRPTGSTDDGTRFDNGPEWER